MTFSKLVVAVAFTSAALLGACADSTTGVSNSAVVQTNSASNAANIKPAATVASIASGKELYADNCAVCHKESGKGGKMEIEGKTIDPDDLTSDKIKKFSDEKMIGYVTNGVVDEGMPAFKDKLTEDEIKRVVQYVRTEIQQMPPSASASPVL